MSTDNNPEGNPPEIKIEIDPTPGEDLPPPSSEASPDLDDLPPVSDDDLDDLPPVPPDGDLDGLPPVDPDAPVDTPIRIDTDAIDADDLPPLDGPPDDGPEGSPDAVGSPPVEVSPPAAVHVGKLVLESVLNPGQNLSMGVNTKLGKRLCKSLGEDSKFLDNEQMELIKTDSGWQVSPNVSAANETLLNNKAITEPQDLNEGDILAVGREAKGVSKMEMRVSFSS